MAASIPELSADDIVTVEMLKNLIANIQVGNITTEERRGEVLDTKRAIICLTMSGNPDGELTLDKNGNVVKSDESLFVRRGG